MKTKLFFPCFMFLLFVAGYVQSQNQQWAVTHDGGMYNEGAIIHVNTNGTGVTVAHDFQGPAGFHPYGDLLHASDGNFYGTCYDGGSFASCTCYRFNPSTGTYTDVYDFDIIHGDFPTSGMVEGPNGKIYGAASSGGASGVGVIYSLDLNTDVYTDLFDLSAPTGFYPYGNPIFHSNGKLYGLTVHGGSNSQGALYSFDVTTNTYVAIHSFDMASGSEPYGSLLEENGKLYGMTSAGGANNSGVIFSFDPVTNVYTNLHDFDGINGAMPKGSLMVANNGLLYGMTNAGGANNFGVIFSFDMTTNDYTKRFDFNTIDGTGPQGSLSGTGNTLCGTTFNGGTNGVGVMFNYNIQNDSYTKVLDFSNFIGAHPTGGFIKVQLTGIPTISEGNNISVFPNPVVDELHISFQANQNENATFELKDLLGKIIYSSSETISYGYSKTIDLTGISKGTYFLVINTEKDRMIKKIMKN